MTPSQKAFIDAHLDIFAACKDCYSRIALYVKSGHLPDPAGLAITRAGGYVQTTLGLDGPDREKISRTPSDNVWQGLCSCRRRWSYSQINLHDQIGQLRVGLRPEPVAAQPSTATPDDSPTQTPAAKVELPGKASTNKKQPAKAAHMAVIGQLRKRAGTRLPFLDPHAPRAPYFATLYRQDQPIKETLAHRKGSFILLLEKRKGPHDHPEPLKRPELQGMRAHAFDEAAPRGGRPALLEVPTEYFDESVLGLCCLNVGILASSCGCLYRPLSADAYDKETPGGFPSAMPDSPHARRGLSPSELRAKIAQEFPSVLGLPARACQESGLFEGSLKDALAARGLNAEPFVLAVEWSTHDYSPEHCPSGHTHPPIMQRSAVRDWLLQSRSTTGYVTSNTEGARSFKSEPMLIEMHDVPDSLDDELCCLSVRLLVPTSGTSFHAFAPGKVRWETR